MRFLSSASSLLFTLLSSLTAFAQPATPQQTYALLSLIGDRLEIVVQGGQTGSRLENNRRDWVPIADAVFDNTAVSAAARGIREGDPTAELTHLNTRSAVLFEKHRTLFEVTAGVMAMPDAIREALVAQKATRLVLMVKNREDAAFQMAGGSFTGSGVLEGLGFYLNGIVETVTRSDNPQGESYGGRGFIAPYVYISVFLVEFPSGRVLARQSTTDSYRIGAGRTADSHHQPWNALSSKEKIDMINQLIDKVMARTLRELVARK